MVEQLRGVDDHLTRVALVARALTASMHQSEIVDIVVRQGMAGLGAEGGVLALLAPDEFVVPVATVGYPTEAIAAFAPMTIGQELPLTVAAREREAVWLGSRAEAAARFPALVAAAVTSSQAWVAIPLVVHDSVFGALGVSFLAPREFSESERMFIQALGDQCALALAAQRDDRLGAEPSADGASTTLVKASRPVREPGAVPIPTQAGAPAGPPSSVDAHVLSSAMFDTSLDAVMFTAPDGQILAANPAACRMFGMSREEICRRGRPGLTDPDDPRWISALREREATGRFFGELSMLRADGTAFPVDVSSAVFENVDGASRTVVVLRDASARKEAEALLARCAHVDELTGALNRRGFFDVALDRVRRAQEAGNAMTLLFVDVDGLKGLNDHWGYATGDAALRETAELLRGAFRADDLVARFGGDEFVVLVEPLHGETPGTLARRVENRVHLRNAQARPFPLRISVGVAPVALGDSMTVDRAIAEAHGVMREGRIRAGRGRSRPRAR